MTQEEKQLLLQDLSARLPYGVFVEYDQGNGVKRATKFHGNYLYLIMLGELQWKDFKPYLRPMSSMDSEEIETYRAIIGSLLENSVTDNVPTLYNFLNSKHLDYNGLIFRGLALEAPKDMYDIKTE